MLHYQPATCRRGLGDLAVFAELLEDADLKRL
jgi:hypothetical protein